ncbi:DUF2188 domain-containing protein [Marinilactibacillus kalidii]|uniref:DUF2188 domain-containing protein n=1 Tax=Marinilactibacillus kalidii TaxID=2820274 RepID=UPI001ABEBDB5|nr:DUF2188 domain-containing protein [Marinilactibacillus kalidii]
MPWDTQDYPAAMKNLDNVVRKKAIDIGNALLDNDYPEDRAIPIAISQAEDWYDKSDSGEIDSFKYQKKPTKHDAHDNNTNSDLLDNDVIVYYADDEWKVETKGAQKPDSTYHSKKEAIDRAKAIASNKESSVITYTKEGKRQ